MIITISYPKCLRIIVGDYINCKAKAFFKDMLIAEFYWSRRNVTSLRKGMNHMSHISYTKALLVYLHWWNSLSRMSKGDNVRLYATVIPETFFGINVINKFVFHSIISVTFVVYPSTIPRRYLLFTRTLTSRLLRMRLLVCFEEYSRCSHGHHPALAGQEKRCVLGIG